MSVFKSQFTRALMVIPSDYCDVPSPSGFIVQSSTTDDCSGNLMTDNGVDFISLNVQPGDIVYCYASNFAATVVNVVDSHTLELNACGIGIGDGYDLYQGPVSGIGNTGCVLVSEGTGTISAVTIGGDVVNLPCTAGIVVPVQVKKVISSTSTSIALW